MAIVLTSKTRYNGGVKVKRAFGSSTVTEFWVEIDGKLQEHTVLGYGPTPGGRKTYALKKVQAELVKEVNQA